VQDFHFQKGEKERLYIPLARFERTWKEDLRKGKRSLQEAKKETKQETAAQFAAKQEFGNQQVRNRSFSQQSRSRAT
jgi:hypothetical protein